MKKVFLFITLLIAFAGCYDDSKIWDTVQKHEDRIAALEQLCSKLNTNITSLQHIVTSLQEIGRAHV